LTSAGGPVGGAAGQPKTDPGDGLDADLRERLVDSRVLHRGHYLTFRVDRIQRADGTFATRDVCGHPGAVAIVALDDEDRVLLVRQWRHAAGRALLEIPAGTLDPDEATGEVEDPALAGPRELEEETGMRAARWRLLASFWTAPGFASELMHLYLATGLSPAADDRRSPDEDERLRLSAVPWRDAVAMAESGEICDAKSLVGLLWLARIKGVEAAGAPPAQRASGRPIPTSRRLCSRGRARRYSGSDAGPSRSRAAW
jgi:ADP-ribose pyrophosphatase